MKVFLEQTSDKSMAISRVVDAFKRYSPSDIEIVPSEYDADLIILHVVGRYDTVKKEAIKAMFSGKGYAVIQYCLMSTQKPNPNDWYSLWKDSELVWSYYDIPGISNVYGSPNDFNFYRAPLGVDKTVFKRKETLIPEYLICTSGQGYLSEGVRECIKAAERVGAPVAHLGPDLGIKGVDYYNGLSDEEVATLLNKCVFVSGLRREEGFELPAIEGFYCGARPIFFDREHYRYWFNDIAEFIPETNRDEIIEDLVHLFQQDHWHVLDSEVERHKKEFEWEDIMGGFWSKIRR